jgi:nucleoside-diphosphate-sugar epimerase
MRALVTGGTGFIGRQVVRKLLDDNHRVRIFSRGNANADMFADRSVEVASGDLANVRSLIDALDGMDVLYHIGEIKNTTKEASEKNIKLIEELLGQIKGHKVRRIVFVSSITVSGIPSTVPADEDTVPRIIMSDHYTDYKRRAEKLLIENAGDVEYSIIRPAPVYGPGSRYLGRFISIIGRFGPFGIPFPGNAENLAPLIHVGDLSAAIARAGIEPGAAGRIFNLTDGLRHSWRDFLEAIAKRLGKRLRIVPLSRLLLQLSALPIDLVSGFLGISFDPVSYITYFSENLFFDNDRARNLLNWQPHYSLSDGINDMVAFYEKKNP